MSLGDGRPARNIGARLAIEHEDDVESSAVHPRRPARFLTRCLHLVEYLGLFRSSPGWPANFSRAAEIPEIDPILDYLPTQKVNFAFVVSGRTGIPALHGTLAESPTTRERKSKPCC